ncbi:MAG: hypothetical protein ACXWUD_10515 [Methylosarcina sp.]
MHPFFHWGVAITRQARAFSQAELSPIGEALKEGNLMTHFRRWSSKFRLALPEAANNCPAAAFSQNLRFADVPGLRPECVLHRPQSRDGYGHDKNIVQVCLFYRIVVLPPGRRTSLGTSSDSLPWADYTRPFIILPEAVLILVMYKWLEEERYAA